MPCYFFSLPLARAQAVKNKAVFIFCSCTSCCFYSEKKTKTLNISVKHFFCVEMFKSVCVKFVTVPALPRDLRVLPGLQKSGSNAGNSACLVRPVQKTPKKVDIKKCVFFSVKWNSLFDFVTSFLWFCVPSQGPSGPPRPPEKRQQPRMYIKLSGQTSTKDLRSILLLHEFDSKKIFT